ncbi:MAG: zinc ribbon domain-containing protein [Pyrinomonadaceae bacterium]|nr:zinc ribbon domain-containing protein [Pyrinomonadaceae bacterium]
MTLFCEHCRGACDEGAHKCVNCGAPISVEAATVDYRVCPHCQRKLLALGSPACSYCGRALPQNYIRTREATLRRIHDHQQERVEGDTAEEWAENEANTVRRLLGNLFGSEGTPRKK